MKHTHTRMHALTRTLANHTCTHLHTITLPDTPLYLYTRGSHFFLPICRESSTLICTSEPVSNLKEHNHALLLLSGRMQLLARQNLSPLLRSSLLQAHSMQSQTFRQQLVHRRTLHLA